MLNRRSLIFGATIAALLAGAPALADDLNPPRERATLVAPPFVMAHEQADEVGPEDHRVHARPSSRSRW